MPAALTAAAVVSQLLAPVGVGSPADPQVRGGRWAGLDETGGVVLRQAGRRGRFGASRLVDADRGGPAILAGGVGRTGVAAWVWFDRSFIAGPDDKFDVDCCFRLRVAAIGPSGRPSPVRELVRAQLPEELDDTVVGARDGHVVVAWAAGRPQLATGTAAGLGAPRALPASGASDPLAAFAGPTPRVVATGPDRKGLRVVELRPGAAPRVLGTLRTARFGLETARSDTGQLLLVGATGDQPTFARSAEVAWRGTTGRLRRTSIPFGRRAFSPPVAAGLAGDGSGAVVVPAGRDSGDFAVHRVDRRGQVRAGRVGLRVPLRTDEEVRRVAVDVATDGGGVVAYRTEDADGRVRTVAHRFSRTALGTPRVLQDEQVLGAQALAVELEPSGRARVTFADERATRTALILRG